TRFDCDWSSDVCSSDLKNTGGSHVAWNDNLPNNATFVDGGAGVANVVSVSSARRAGRLTFDAGAKNYSLNGGSIQLSGAAGTGRSEERRVGKGCRVGRW